MPVRAQEVVQHLVADDHRMVQDRTGQRDVAVTVPQAVGVGGLLVVLERAHPRYDPPANPVEVAGSTAAGLRPGPHLPIAGRRVEPYGAEVGAGRESVATGEEEHESGEPEAHGGRERVRPTYLPVERARGRPHTVTLPLLGS